MARQVHPTATRFPASIELSFPYDLGFISTLKADIPPEYRTYNPHSKVWTVRHPHDAFALDLFRATFPGATVYSFGQQQQQRPPYVRQEAPASPFATLHLLDSAPPEVVNAAYKALMRKHHPDVVAPEQKLLAHQATTKLNAAYEALRERGAA